MPPASSVPGRRALALALGVGLLFLIAGLLVGLRTVATTVLPHMVRPGPYLEFQEVIPGQPMPRLVDWNLTLVHMLLLLRDLPPAVLALMGALMLGLLWLVTVSVLNPTFRPLRLEKGASGQGAVVREEGIPGFRDSGIPEDMAPGPQPSALPSDLNTRTPEHLNIHLTLHLNGPHLKKALRCLLPVALPVALVWLLSDRLLGGVSGGAGGLLFALALGLALWIGFAPNGLAGDFATEERRLQREALPGLLVPGALFGVGLWLLLACLPASLETVMTRYQMLGSFHKGYFGFIVPRYLLGAGLIAFGAGALLTLLGRSRQALPHRLALLVLVLLCALGSIGLRQPFTAAHMAKTFDITPDTIRAITVPYSPKKPDGGTPNGPAGAQLFSPLVGVPFGAQPSLPDRDLLLFYPRGVQIVRQLGITEDGLCADPAYADPVRQFLASRHYQTAYSWVAMKHLYYVGIVNFDVPAAISALLLDLENCPHISQFGNTTRSMLYTCSAAPENLELLNRFADPARFAYPDRDSIRIIGNLYWRFGEREKALEWYRKAEMPRSFLARIQNEPLPLKTGKVTGQVTLNGRPLAGVKVGLLPRGLPAAPRDIASVLIQVQRELVPDFTVEPFYPRYHPRPWALRFLTAGATTDARGAFTLPYLNEGNYILICALPPNLKLRLPTDDRLQIQNAPKRITVQSQTPSVNLGTIALTYPATPTAAAPVPVEAP